MHLSENMFAWNSTLNLYLFIYYCRATTSHHIFFSIQLQTILFVNIHEMIEEGGSVCWVAHICHEMVLQH